MAAPVAGPSSCQSGRLDHREVLTSTKVLETSMLNPIPDDPIAFPTLDDAEVALLDALGTRRSVTAGEYLYQEGDATYEFFVVLSGTAEILVRSDGEEQ